jgi:hypothetical protein
MAGVGITSGRGMLWSFEDFNFLIVLQQVVMQRRRGAVVMVFVSNLKGRGLMSRPFINRYQFCGIPF